MNPDKVKERAREMREEIFNIQNAPIFGDWTKMDAVIERGLTAAINDAVGELERDKAALLQGVKDGISALDRSYDAQEWPANGSSFQEKMAVQLRELVRLTDNAAMASAKKGKE